jgi:hypothetical protein
MYHAIKEIYCALRHLEKGDRLHTPTTLFPEEEPQGHTAILL